MPVGVAAGPAWSARRGVRGHRRRGLRALAVVPIALGWAAWRLGRAQARLPLVLPLDRAARAVVDAYRELGEMSDAAAGSLEIEPRASGYLRCVLTEATPEESARFATALDELVAVADAPRYLVAPPAPGPRRRRRSAARPRAHAAPAVPARHHPVPADLGRNKERAAAFARAWSRRWAR